MNKKEEKFLTCIELHKIYAKVEYWGMFEKFSGSDKMV